MGYNEFMEYYEWKAKKYGRGVNYVRLENDQRYGQFTCGGNYWKLGGHLAKFKWFSIAKIVWTLKFKRGHGPSTSAAYESLPVNDFSSSWNNLMYFYRRSFAYIRVE